jgi:acyl-coenzyme A thioesterase PaaI-like protein
MKVDPTIIPINVGLGLRRHPEPGFLFSIDGQPSTVNFLGTIHATAIYALVDATSGEVLQRAIDLDWSRCFAVSRDTRLAIRKPSREIIKATGHVHEGDLQHLTMEFIEERMRKVRVLVEVFNENDEIAARAEVTWVLGKHKGEGPVEFVRPAS